MREQPVMLHVYCCFSWGLSAISSSQKEVTSEPVSPMSPVWSSTDLTPLAVSSTVSFTDIVQDAQQQREAWQRAANKPLNLIQVVYRSSDL